MVSRGPNRLFFYDLFLYIFLLSSSQSQSSYIIRNPQQRRISQSQPVRGRDEEQDDIVSADVEEVSFIFVLFSSQCSRPNTLAHALTSESEIYASDLKKILSSTS